MRFNNYQTRSMGGGFSLGPGFISPFIKVMLIANAGIFVLQNFSHSLLAIGGLWPSRFFSEFPNLLYQPLTYMFLHGSFGHIFFNMFMLWMFGTEIERSIGTRRFARFYILSGLCGAILSLMVNPGLTIPIVGASGAIWGVMVAYWIMFPDRYLYLYFLFPVKVKWAIPGFLLIGMLFQGGNIAHMAHLGGAICGFIYFKANWRSMGLGRRVKNLGRRRKEAKLEKNRQKAEDIMKRVDQILDRINEVGIDNISKADRKFLDEASSELSRKKQE